MGGVNNYKKNRVEELRKKYFLIDSNEDIVTFVWELICDEVNRLKREEPYATRTINDYENAEHIVYDLINEIEDAE